MAASLPDAPEVAPARRTQRPGTFWFAAVRVYNAATAALTAVTTAVVFGPAHDSSRSLMPHRRLLRIRIGEAIFSIADILFVPRVPGSRPAAFAVFDQPTRTFIIMRFALLCLAALFALPAAAADLTVSNAWVRYLPGGLPAGGYFTLHNSAGHSVYLTGAETSSYGRVMLHQTMSMNGMTRMAPVEKVEVPPHGELRFAPGGYHLMLMAPKVKVAPGDVVPITLHFDDGETLTAQFAVRGPSGQ